MVISFIEHLHLQTNSLMVKYLKWEVIQMKIKNLKEKIKALPDVVANYIDNFQFREGLQGIMSLTKEANKYFNDKKPWKGVKEDIESHKHVLTYQTN